MSVSLLLTCAGKGTRANLEKNKLLYKFDGATVIEKSLSAFYKTGLIDEYIVTVSNEDYEEIKSILPSEVKIVIGGQTRTDSVKKGLQVATCDIVLIHDGARPFVSKKVIEDCIDTVKNFGSAIPVIPATNTQCFIIDDVIENYIGKDEVAQIQTPQGFFTKEILNAYSKIGDETFNDDGEVYKTFVSTPHVYKGDSANVKLTYKEDFEKLNRICSLAVGVGFDCHKLVNDRKLILGGIEIPHDKGLLGHSDADVLTHAIMDAMLSAVSQRDIGFHFPDTDEKYKGACSIDLLKRVIEICKESGYKLKSLSAVIMAEKPKLLKHIPNIAKNLADVLNINTNDIGIGATTLEGLGFVGREEGICVSASCTMVEI